MLETISMWLFLFVLLGWIGAPLGRLIAPNTFDQGAGLGRVLGLAQWMFVFWIIPSISPIPATPSWAVGSLLLVVGLNAYILHRFKQGPWILLGSYGVWVEAGLFSLLWASFLFIQSGTAELWGPDHAMDFVIFHSAVTTSHFPPPDLWFAGETVNYYYLGQLLFVPITKMIGIPSEVAVTLSVASVLPLAAGVFFTLAGRVPCSIGRPIWAALLVILVGNFGTAYLLLEYGSSFDWHRAGYLFGVLAELPLTLNFNGTFHAIFITWPITLATAAVLATWPKAESDKRPLFALLAGGLVGLHDGLHTWAIPPLLLLTFISIVQIQENSNWTRREWILNGLLFSVALLVSALPFELHHVKPPLVIRYVGRDLRSELNFFLLHWGALFLPFAILGLPRLGRLAKNVRVILAIFSATAVLTIGASFGLVFVLASAFFLGKWNEEAESSYSRALSLAAFGLILLVELVCLPDPIPVGPLRSNTVGKNSYIAWGFLLLALPSVWKNLGKASRAICACGWIITLLIIPVVLLNWGTPQYRTLDSLAWFTRGYPADGEAIRWLKERTQPEDRTVEGATEDRPGSSILSTVSGRPTVVAMTNLIKLNRSNRIPEIIQRTRDVEEIYTTADTGRVKELLAKYHVSFVILSARERMIYQGASFEGVTKLPIAFQAGHITLYAARQ